MKKKLTEEQHKYLRELQYYVDIYQHSRLTYTKEIRGVDCYITELNTTYKQSTINRILKTGEYNEEEGNYLNKLKTIYIFLKQKYTKGFTTDTTGAFKYIGRLTYKQRYGHLIDAAMNRKIKN